MLWDASGLKGHVILGSDGPLGTVSDMLFDDTSWRLRWLVANTHYWLPGREALLPASSLCGLDIWRRQVAMNLAVDQIRANMETRPSARGDRDLHSAVVRHVAGPSARPADPSLRSVEAVVHHRVHTADGVVGCIDDLLIDDTDYSIRYVRIDVGNWRPGATMLIAPRSLRAIDWRGRLIGFEVDCAAFENGPYRAPRTNDWLPHSESRCIGV